MGLGDCIIKPLSLQIEKPIWHGFMPGRSHIIPGDTVSRSLPLKKDLRNNLILRSKKVGGGTFKTSNGRREAHKDIDIIFKSFWHHMKSLICLNEIAIFIPMIFYILANF